MTIDTSPLNMQVSPWDIMRQRMDAKMYQPQNTRGPFFFAHGPNSQFAGMRGLAGLGASNVGPLASSLPRNGSFVSTQYQQFAGYPITDYTGDCLDDATSAQIAALLGGVVVKLPVEDILPTNGPVPKCNWIQTQDGIVRAADIYQVGKEACSIPGLTAACCVQQLLANVIPGGQMDPSCSYQAGYSNPMIPPGGPAFIPDAPPYVPPTNTGTGAGTTQTQAVTPKFQFSNLSTGQQIGSNGAFKVGDSFSVVISNAAPNANVTVTANQNGQTSSTVIGKTSAGGSFQTSGVMDASTVGSWSEQWQVPAGSGVNALATSVAFSVSAPITTPVLPTTGVTLPTGGGSTPTTDTITPVGATAMTCNDVANQIAQAQAAGWTNAQLLETFQKPGSDLGQYLNCPAVLALQPSSNTMLYVGLAAAALLLFAMRGN